MADIIPTTVSPSCALDIEICVIGTYRSGQEYVGADGDLAADIKAWLRANKDREIEEAARNAWEGMKFAHQETAVALRMGQ